LRSRCGFRLVVDVIVLAQKNLAQRVLPLALLAFLLIPSACAAEKYDARCLGITAPDLVYHGQHVYANLTFQNTGTSYWPASYVYLYNSNYTAFTWKNGTMVPLPSAVLPGREKSFLLEVYSVGSSPGPRTLSGVLKYYSRSGYVPFGEMCTKDVYAVGFVNATAGTASATQITYNSTERYAYSLTFPFTNNGYSAWQPNTFVVYVNASSAVFPTSTGGYASSISIGLDAGEGIPTWSSKTFTVIAYPPILSTAYTLKVSGRMQNLTGSPTLFGTQGDVSFIIPAATPTPAPSPSPLPSPSPSPLPSPSPSPLPSPSPSPLPSPSPSPLPSPSPSPLPSPSPSPLPSPSPSPTPTPVVYYWVNGTVVDPTVSGNPGVSYASVYLHGDSAYYGYHVADGSGNFSFYLPPGGYILNASATGYVAGNNVTILVSSVNLSPTVFANHTITVNSSNNGSIYGKVSDYYSGAAIAGVNVTLFLTADGTGTYVSNALSAADGYYYFSQLAPGNYSLTAASSSYLYPDAKAVEVSSSQSYVEFQLVPKPYIYGFVKDSDGNYLESALVNATPSNSGSSPVTTYTNSSGGYRFDSLITSNYTLRVSKDGYVPMSTSNVPEPNSQGVRVDFSLSVAANATTTPTPSPSASSTPTPAPSPSAFSTPTPAPTYTPSVPISQAGCLPFTPDSVLVFECNKSGGFYEYDRDKSTNCITGGHCSFNFTSEPVPSPSPQAASYSLPFSSSGQKEAPAEIFGLDYSTSPSVIVEDKVTNLTGVVNASKAAFNFSCSGPSDCACRMGKVNVNGKLQDNYFEPDATGESGFYFYNISCNFSIPVNGNYSIFAFDVDQGVQTNGVMIQFVPNQRPIVYILAPTAEPVPVVVVVASVVIALGILAFAAFSLFDFMFRDARKVAQLEAQKAQILEDIKMVKYRFMKRQIDEVTLKKTMAEKEKEYTLIVSQLKTLKRDLKDAEQ